ncbi:hypothetical protein BDZ89DRAFT_1074496 [Hymenopellis radicata]|nr:hypothetical protein BDZ89DRAFT_1074496 [Hymenopellis radicata]
MTLIHWLLETLNRIFPRQRLRLSRLLHLWTILRRCFSRKGPKSQRLPPSNDTARTRNEYKRHVDDEVVVHCSSLAPNHISPSGSQSSHDLTAEQSRRHLLPGAASHTPSSRSSQSSSPVGIVMSTVDPSPIEEESGPSALFAQPGAAHINLEDYDDLELTTRYLPPRSRTPSMRTASIRTASIRAPSVRAPSMDEAASLRSMRGVSPAPSRQELTSPVHVPSPFAGSHLVTAVDNARPDLCDTNELFWPTAPEFLRDMSVTPNEETEFKIDPLSLSFKIEHDHKDWEVHIHPEGARYFSHRTRRIFTDADLCDPDVTTLVTSFIEQMDEFIRVQNIDIPATADFVFDLIRAESDNRILCAYYFADHANRSIFWLDTYYAHYFPIWSEINGATSVSHVVLVGRALMPKSAPVLTLQLRYHCQLFPNCLPLTVELVDFLRDLLIYAIGDMVMSAYSMSPYDISDLQQILTLANDMRQNATTSKGVAPGSISCLGRFLYVFVRQRFFHFYGQSSARLECDRSVYGGPVSRRTLLITSVSPLLFFAPEVHLRVLEKIWVDNILNPASWATFISKLRGEWQEFILYATVLLNANVAFLSIQSVDDASDSPSRSAAQITSYLSVITSVGSIIIGLLLVLQHRSKAKETSRDALSFLNAQKHEMLALETLAIMYSLPYAMLMWGMVSFLAAFSLMCLVASSATVRVLVGGGWLIIACMVLWCITMSRDAMNSDRWYMKLINFGVLLWIALAEKIRVSAPPIVQTLRKFPWQRASDSGQAVV